MKVNSSKLQTYLTIILILYRSNRPGSRRPSERVIITIYGNQPDKADYAHLPEWIQPQEGVTGLSSVIFRVGFLCFPDTGVTT